MVILENLKTGKIEKYTSVYSLTSCYGWEEKVILELIKNNNGYINETWKVSIEDIKKDLKLKNPIKDKKRLFDCFRTAVRLYFKTGDIGECTFCDETDIKKLEHHHSNITFEKLLKDFLISKDIYSLKEVLYIMNNENSKFLKLINDWKTFHNERAIIIILCKNCHKVVTITEKKDEIATKRFFK